MATYIRTKWASVIKQILYNQSFHTITPILPRNLRYYPTIFDIRPYSRQMYFQRLSTASTPILITTKSKLSGFDKFNSFLKLPLYFREHGLPCRTKGDMSNVWCNRSVLGILENMTYIGHTVNFRTATQNYKTHKKIRQPKENWLIFENTHPPLLKSRYKKSAEVKKK